MKITGPLTKMKSITEGVIQYFLLLGTEVIPLNDFLGTNISLTYLNQITCIRCGKKTKTSFAQGYCYPCFIKSPETEECVLNPEKCRAHEGVARDMEYARHNCLIDHTVYLADSGGLKVGVTRNTQLITRWIDQGAASVIKLAQTPNRYLAGIIEVTLKKYYPDKTNWRLMLTNQSKNSPDLFVQKLRAIDLLTEDLKPYVTNNNDIVKLCYPVLDYPEKVLSMGFDNHKTISGKLIGIRGQYLIFEDGLVLNIRKHSGYNIDFEY
jgi:hypothetical protein